MATHSFRLRPIMKQGTAGGIPETWTHYPSVEDARAGAKLMYQKRSRPARDTGDRQRWIIRGMDRAMTAARTVIVSKGESS